MLLPLHASPAFRLRQLLRPFILVCLSLFSATALMLVLSPHVYTFSQWPWKAARTSTSGPELDYVVFSSNSNSIDARPHPHFKQILPEWCLDAHFAFGSSCSPNPTGKYVVNAKKFDLVWTWVNSSDPRLRSAMREAGLVEEPTANKLYRDHDELRHSFRSILRHFRAHTKSFQLFTSDFPKLYPNPDTEVQNLLDTYAPSNPESELTEEDDEELDELEESDDVEFELRDAEIADGQSATRFGLRPSWLLPGPSAWKDGDVDLGIQFQSDVFDRYEGTSFNSYSIETQLHRLTFPSTADVFIYLNDDFYMMADMVPADFHTTAMGTVLRLEPDLIVGPDVDEAKITPTGEWGPLYYSNQLLSDRFGRRGRPYTKHVPKALSRSLLLEASLIWPNQLLSTASHKFRGEVDAYIVFLSMHLIVERWREALLWSWVVTRIGGSGQAHEAGKAGRNEDGWGAEEKERAWSELGGDLRKKDSDVRVRMEKRMTVDEKRVKAVLRKGGDVTSDRTAYAFSSGDGYPYGFSSDLDKWPRFSGMDVGRDLCKLNYAKCIAPAASASEAFKRIAFEEPTDCGDCIIHALRAASGELGLSAFLPDSSRTFQSKSNSSTTLSSDDDIPRLPLVNIWRDGDFSLQSVLSPHSRREVVNIRRWTLRLMERYRFVIGETGTAFVMIETPEDARDKLFGWMNRDWWISLLCVNDDITEEPRKTDELIREWETQRWGDKAHWER